MKTEKSIYENYFLRHTRLAYNIHTYCMDESEEIIENMQTVWILQHITKEIILYYTNGMEWNDTEMFILYTLMLLHKMVDFI